MSRPVLLPTRGAGGPRSRGGQREVEDLVQGDGYNISEGGLALSGTRTFPAGTLLNVKFRFESPAAQFFSAQAIVRHTEEGQMGVEFIDLGPSEKARILEMIYRDIAIRRR